VFAACVTAVGLVIGISVYRSSHNPRVPLPQQTHSDPIAVRQQAATDAADKLVAADDLARTLLNGGVQRTLHAQYH
jgi:hypothetical protein